MSSYSNLPGVDDVVAQISPETNYLNGIAANLFAAGAGDTPPMAQSQRPRRIMVGELVESARGIISRIGNFLGGHSPIIPLTHEQLLGSVSSDTSRLNQARVGSISSDAIQAAIRSL